MVIRVIRVIRVTWSGILAGLRYVMFKKSLSHSKKANK